MPNCRRPPSPPHPASAAPTCSWKRSTIWRLEASRSARARARSSLRAPRAACHEASAAAKSGCSSIQAAAACSGAGPEAMGWCLMAGSWEHAEVRLTQHRSRLAQHPARWRHGDVSNATQHTCSPPKCNGPCTAAAAPHLHIPAALCRQHVCQESVAGVWQRTQLSQRAQRLPLRLAEGCGPLVIAVPLAARRAAAN